MPDFLDLTDLSLLRGVLERHGVQAKKGLGQHFLHSKAAVRAIVGRIVGFGGVFEIGPGPGVLTGPLSETVEEVVALEVDARMREILAETAPKAEVVEGDALEVDLGLFLNSLPGPRAVVSNLPYYITGPLITQIARSKCLYEKAVLMMQKEVAVRVLAPPGSSDRGSLSVFLQAGFEIAKVADVPAGAFWPPPKVDSTVLELIAKPVGLSDTEEALVRRAFRQPRKTLANNLAAAGFSREIVESSLGRAGLDPRCRPADPDLVQWGALFAALIPADES